jgi:5-oxoprolinase (ATP-hydrolysing)
MAPIELELTAGPRWQFWIDRGGTFTDVIGLSPTGELRAEKLLSDNAHQYADAATAGIRRILGIANQEAIPANQIESVKIGTTIATNALLERKGEPTVFVTNKGFGDCLRIAYQNRPDIFARQIILPEQLYSHVIEIDCRVDFNGRELKALNEEEATIQMRGAFDLGFRSCAIALMHGYKFSDQERRLQEIAAHVGFTQISTSHDTSPLVKLISRGDTTVADACLSPILKRYVAQVQNELKGVRLLFMQSNGGLTDALHFRGKDSLLSGPAGGVVGAASVGIAAGCQNIIAFDMGGTSTDVSHISGALERTTDATIGGVRVKTPMIAINTVAAGGGSICSFDGFRMRVGPTSAGANPGPACYGKGGPLTITDCNLLLGIIQPEYFPKVFGEHNNIGLDKTCVQKLFDDLCEKISPASATAAIPEAVAQGFLAIAVAKMAGAIKQISIERGHDIAGYALVAFGGAGGQHACQIADALGMKKILIHPLAGVLSAYGIGTAKVACVKNKSIEMPLVSENLPSVREALTELCMACECDLANQLNELEKIAYHESLAIRYQGTDSPISVQFADLEKIRSGFEKIHSERFGFISPEKNLVIESICVNAEAKMPAPKTSPLVPTAEGSTRPKCGVYLENEWQQVDLWTTADMSTASRIDGPALIADKMSTTLIERGWQGVLSENGTVIISRTQAMMAADHEAQDDLEKANPARLELFNHIFMSTAEQMGAALQSTSQSINIKERLDFSCAIFDQNGKLVANAPHIPVHLGSMSACVQQIISNRKNSIAKGDVYVSNNPYAGGTHLPDITVVSPVFVSEESPSFYLASRGHHSDIGGITPGSMPADSHSLNEEGVVIDDFQLVKNGKFFEAEILHLLQSSEFPARNPAQNIADLKAQIAANVRGEHALLALCNQYGLNTIQRYMRFVQENAELAVRSALALLTDGTFTCAMDDGAAIKVTVNIDRSTDSATIDFQGTSNQLTSNMNAPKSITNAAVMYVFRTLIDDDIPLNDGFLVPLKIRIPADSFLNPKFPAAIVAGNVETSQQITDALYGALGVLAASQGTMNNFTFGDGMYQYYETICGGSGAGPDFDGTSAVQTNMTNSRLTDPEILEMRFPVILEEFSIRKDSGGTGKHQGGDGVIRRIKFCQSMSASILSQRRKIAPFGLNGGKAGDCGANYVIQREGLRVDLGPTATIEIQAGDTFVIETPGGGGFGN